MISPTTTPQYFGTTSSTSSTTGGSKSLDKDAFLKLLVAQLKHQDPNSPLQPHELAAQLAQFTSVEQLTQLNEAVATQTQASQMAALVGQSNLSASLIGREVEAVGDLVRVPTTGSANVTVDVTGAGGAATLTLKDDSGNTIATRSIGTLQAGNGQKLTLPADLPPGKWHYAIEVKSAGDATTTVTTYTTGVVTGVEFKNGQIVLSAGGLDIALDYIVRIQPASTSTTSGSGGGTTGGTTSTTSGTSGSGGPVSDVIENVVQGLLGRH